MPEQIATTTTAPKVEPVAEAIEEDDEFEEFVPCKWDARDEDAEDAQQWQVSTSFACVVTLGALIVCDLPRAAMDENQKSQLSS